MTAGSFGKEPKERLHTLRSCTRRPDLAKRDRMINSHARELPIIIFTVVVVVVFSTATQNFLSIGNLRVLGDQSAQIGIVSVTVTMVIILGGIDLSVGSLMALVAAVVGILLNLSVAPPLACLI